MTRGSADGGGAATGSGKADLPYRPCVGIMVLNAQNQVFVARRIDQARSGRGDQAWQMPQGGIDPGETPRAAAMRELAEETGIRDVEILAESDDWLAYDLPDHLIGRLWGGRYRGQTQKWFAARFTGDDASIDLAAHNPEFDAWQWVSLDALPRLIVPFKRDVYERVVAEFRTKLSL